ncbi:MAG: SOS response-associated peptidase [Candidatus Sumerlaeota bacterium]
MCARYNNRRPERLQPGGGTHTPAQLLRQPDPPAAPGTFQPVIVVENGVRIERMMKWGLVPHWSRDGKAGPFNARAETIAELPTFREPFKKRRGLVEMECFYEWANAGTKNRKPYKFFLKSGEPFTVAAVWDTWSKGQTLLLSYTLITTAPNELIKPLHHRMAVILPPGFQDEWLDPLNNNVDSLLRMLSPYPAESMACEPVAPLPSTRSAQKSDKDLFGDL